MTEEVRFTVRMPEEEADMLADISRWHQRPRSAMVRWLIRQAHAAGSDVGNCSSFVRQRCVSGASAVPTNDEQVTHGTEDATRAPAIRTDPEKKKRTKRGPGELFAHPFRETFDGLEWYGATLPPSVAADAFLEQCEREFPGVDIEAEMIAASGWLQVNPTKRKKQLGPFLRGWFKRSLNPPEWQKAAKQQADAAKSGKPRAVGMGGFWDTP